MDHGGPATPDPEDLPRLVGEILDELGRLHEQLELLARAAEAAFEGDGPSSHGLRRHDVERLRAAADAYGRAAAALRGPDAQPLDPATWWPLACGDKDRDVAGSGGRGART